MYRRDYSEGAAFFFEVLIGMVLIAIMAGIVGFLFQACHPEKPQYYIVMSAETTNESELRTRKDGAYHHQYIYNYTVMRAEFLRADGSENIEMTKTLPGHNSINYALAFGDLVVVDDGRIYEIPTLAEWINLQKGEG